MRHGMALIVWSAFAATRIDHDAGDAINERSDDEQDEARRR